MVRTHPDISLSQEAFGKRLGITGASISRVESGDRSPSEQLTLAICREFNVNEEWLRTGQGDMFNQSAYFDLGAYARQQGATEIEIQLVKAYFDLAEETRQEIVGKLMEIFGSQQQVHVTNDAPPD